jgi:hypothetical protein
VPPGDSDRGFRFKAGIIFIAASFLVYPAYFAIPFLPLSNTMKLSITLLLSLLSWGMFCAGSYLSGREGYEWLKACLRR